MGSIRQLLAKVPDAEMRMRRLNRFVTTAPPAEVVVALERAAHHTHELPDRILWTSLTQLLMEARPRPSLEAGPFVLEPRKEWPGAVRVAQIIGVAARLQATFVPTLLREMWRLPDRADERVLAPHITIEHLPLGVRRERARGPKRALLTSLLVETHPSVVTLLARNPRLREPDAVRLTALRPQHPYALWAMLLCPRWLSSPRVLEAIALNPACKPWMLLALLPLLPSAVAARALRTHAPDFAEVARGLHRGGLVATVDELVAREKVRPGPIIIRIDPDEVEGDLDEVISAAASSQERARSELATPSADVPLPNDATPASAVESPPPADPVADAATGA